MDVAINNVLAISPLDGRYFNKLGNLSQIVSEFGLNKFRLQVEIEWFKFLFTLKEIGLPQLAIEEIAILDDIIDNFDAEACVELKQLEATTNHDVKAVEYYIKKQLVAYPSLNKYKEFVHFACTSEDINNLSYALMLQKIQKSFLLPQITLVTDRILELADKYRNVAMMCRTHGQPATPSTMGKELYNVSYRLQRQLQQLSQQEILGKMNGAVGNYNAHVVCYPDVAWDKMIQKFVVERLGLAFNPYTTQIEPHDYMAELFDNLKRINVILIDFVRDIWSYISINYFKQKVVANEVGSSTMPHKVNPIDFENGEGNLGVANSLLSHMADKLPISRYQRDLTDSTVQRNIGVATGYSLLAYSSILKGLSKLEINHEAIVNDLDNNWELLAEPIQMAMRKCGISNSYEQLKELTRGKKINQAIIREFINSLSIPDEDKERLLTLTPHTYIGLASKLY
jgi:adenylosuccinate lyase